MSAWIGRFRNSPLPRLLYSAHLAYVGVRRPTTVGVRTMVLDRRDRVLLVRHSYRPGWYFPGGGVRKWETMQAAAIREAREEAGVEVLRIDRLLGVYGNFMESKSDHVALFLAGEWRDGPAPNSPEIAEHAFFALDGLPDDATDATRRRVDEFLGRAPPTDLW